MQQRIIDIIQRSIDVKEKVLADSTILEAIQNSVELIVNAFKQGGRVYFCGNGGSAADAQHLAAEFSGRFYKDRKALPAEALHVNTSYLTSVANDYGYDQVYSRLLDGIGKKGDVLIGLSTSGNSPNILNACKTAMDHDMTVIGFTGQSGGRMAEYCQILIQVPDRDTPRIQECHIMIGHIICELAEEKYFQ